MGAVYHRGRSQIVSTSESHGGDLIIQRYDQSSWRVRLLQCSHSFKGARQVRGQGRLNYLKAKRQLERRWTRRSTTLPQRRIYRLQRKGYRCKATDIRPMGLVAPWYYRAAKELHKTSVDGLLIKIAESEGLRVDAGVLDQGTK
ncbi:hypothetical protein BHE74_00005782 [Ensete ventricosum]|nr:hypothetical protein BHE74_00005782 [Ensete ventricosum]